MVQSTNTQKLTDAQIIRFKILDTLQGQGMFRQRQSTNQQTWSPYLYASVEIFSKLPNKLSSYLDPNNSIDILKTCIDYLLSAPNENIAGIFPRDLNGNNIFANGRIIDQDILVGSPCLVAAKMAFSPIGMIGESAHDNKILSMDEEFFSDFSEIYHESRQAILLTIYNLMVIELLKSSYRSIGKVDKQVTENTINGAIYYYHKITSIENQFVTVMPNVIFSTTE